MVQIIMLRYNKQFYQVILSVESFFVKNNCFEGNKETWHIELFTLLKGGVWI